jgi:phenylacetate-CoA ligase
MLRNGRRAPEALRLRQERQLRALVRHAATRVPFYRDLYAAHGLRPQCVQSLLDLPSLPIVDKRQLRAAGELAQSLDAPSGRVRIRTSGSSGEPFEFQIDRRYDQWRKAQYLRPYLCGGQRLRDKVLRITAHAQRRSPWFSRLGMLREWQFDCGTDPARIAQAWRRLAPDVLQGYPSSLRTLAHHCLERGAPLEPAPRLIFTDSEMLLPDTRALLERQFRAPVLDIFGTFETDNIAFQCSRRAGYHVATDCVALEIVREGQPVPIGEEGEIVATVLANWTRPFIRYNLGDIGRLSPDDCPCGLPFPLLVMLQGRANDQIVLADGQRRTPPGILTHLAAFIDSILQYQLRQTAVRRFELLVVPSSRFARESRAAIVAAMERALVDGKVELRLVDAIPADRSGKRRAFVSEIAAHTGG